MAETAFEPLEHLPEPAARLGATFARPRRIAIVCIVTLTALGWGYLALMTVGLVTAAPAARLGPGMELFDLVVTPGGRDLLGTALLTALCQPSFGSGSALAFGADLLAVFAMWAAMVLAMMLPSAGPMIVTYAEIADTAAGKGERTVSPLVLAAGYGAVWLGFAGVATVLQVLMLRLSLLDSGMASASGLFSGAVFILAGLYQFSALKHACVTLCQRPMPFFFANWTTRSSGVFRLGLRQGLFCLGCCFAMMLVMFAVGVMNVIWMAALGAIMAAEKVATTTRFSRVIGVALLAIGVTFIAVAVAAHWPGRVA